MKLTYNGKNERSILCEGNENLCLKHLETTLGDLKRSAECCEETLNTYPMLRIDGSIAGVFCVIAAQTEIQFKIEA